MNDFAYQIYDGHTQESGTIDVFAYTNDNLDLGYPNEYAEWSYIVKNKAAFFQRVGGKSRIGCSGIKVTVKLDGKVV
jgi:hypothetical protein